MVAGQLHAVGVWMGGPFLLMLGNCAVSVKHLSSEPVAAFGLERKGGEACRHVETHINRRLGADWHPRQFSPLHPLRRTIEPLPASLSATLVNCRQYVHSSCSLPFSGSSFSLHQNAH
jgi:hypothetical protein